MKKSGTDPIQQAWDKLAKGAPRRPDYEKWLKQFDAKEEGSNKMKFPTPPDNKKRSYPRYLPKKGSVKK
jgi:hypothetical protein